MSTPEQQFAVLGIRLFRQRGGVDHGLVPDLFSPVMCRDGRHTQAWNSLQWDSWPEAGHALVSNSQSGSLSP